ncbi:diguanylate cyclase [Devosia sp.]|uniref:GGDEF domain-containing protein n=1 Tax=Devosia sp. TaxID=1871048 RepID=UPI003FA5E8CA
MRVALCNTAEMLGLQGRHDLACAYLERSAGLPGDPGPSLRIHYLYTFGDILLRSGDPHQARTVVAEALTLADACQQVDHQVNCAHKLAEILEALGDATSALAMFRRFHTLYVTQSGEAARRRARVEEIRSETEQWRSRAATLAGQALSDPLTGIANRRSFDQILNRLAGTPVALAILDLDHFKAVNDLFSHIVGDAVLQRVARAIVGQIGPHGHAARLGGEEFGLIFPDASEATAAAFCEGIRVAISCTDWSDVAPGLLVTASIGLAAGDGTIPSGELMQAADNRLYIAKTNGRDRIVITDGPVLLADDAADRQRWLA